MKLYIKPLAEGSRTARRLAVTAGLCATLDRKSVV